MTKTKAEKLGWKPGVPRPSGVYLASDGETVIIDMSKAEGPDFLRVKRNRPKKKAK